MLKWVNGPLEDFHEGLGLTELLLCNHMGPEGVLNWKKTPFFFVDAKRSQIAQEFQKHKS